ncbi:MAG: class I tRNA ligase family protein, partial [Gammaproteobacteria bacterium]|nr:class I tRNA ligase family protein [Gammaproteobacteria bacterium]
SFYPTNVLVTGFDIIFFWVVRMVMMGLKFTGKIPFREVYITGLIRDSAGQKMSKSKGNVLDPLDLVDGISLDDLLAKRTRDLMQPALAKKIERETRLEFPDGIKAHGMDALRFTFCALASTGRDINFDLSRLEGYRNFCNKIWNAARFVLMQENVAAGELSLADRWIRARLQSTICAVHESIASYRFDMLAQTLYGFIWGEYCDWYLELCKAEAKIGTTMFEVLETLLRLIHPIMPFISEEIWQQVAPLVGKQGATIMLEPYPQFDAKFDAKFDDSVAVAEISWLQQMVISIRNIRGAMSIAPKKPLTLLLQKGDTNDKVYLTKTQSYLTKLANIEKISWLKEGEAIPQSATALVSNLELHIPLAGVIDMAAERQRLEKEIAKLKQEMSRSENKLNNNNYIAKAPADVVAKEQMRLNESQVAIEKLQLRLKKSH